MTSLPDGASGVRADQGDPGGAAVRHAKGGLPLRPPSGDRGSVFQAFQRRPINKRVSLFEKGIAGWGGGSPVSSVVMSKNEDNSDFGSTIKYAGEGTEWADHVSRLCSSSIQ